MSLNTNAMHLLKIKLEIERSFIIFSQPLCSLQKRYPKLNRHKLRMSTSESELVYSDHENLNFPCYARTRRDFKDKNLILCCAGNSKFNKMKATPHFF